MSLRSIPKKGEQFRLNKFIAQSGLCSRREADVRIANGEVTVNGKLVTEMGLKVTMEDKVEVEGKALNPEPTVYLLLNKPKNTITTTSDEHGRNTVMDEIEHATGYRVYPVGRLDRNTTGILLLTNDGDLAYRLMHPSYKVRKTYEVVSERALTMMNWPVQKIVPLDDGVAAHKVQGFADTPDRFQCPYLKESPN